MTTMNRELYEALLDAGANSDKAAAASESVPSPNDLVTRYDLKTLEVSLVWKIIGLLGVQTGLLIAILKLFPGGSA